jgi:hypothetical membrane protein
MPRTVFSRARWATRLAALLAIASMTRYPGGTPLDPSSKGYSITHNFLSDLGMTVAYDGQPNAAGALLFVLSLCIIVVVLGGCLVGLIRLYSASPASRRLARAAGVAGLFVCAAFTGVAFTPENRVMGLHIQFTLLAFRIFPVVPLLFALASFHSKTLPRRVAAAWAGLSVVLAGYVIMLGWGPSLQSPEGLVTQVAAQKIVTVVAVAIIVYQSVEADRGLTVTGTA